MDDVQVDRRVRKLSDELKSPYCPGKTLMTCTSYQAFELRGEMKQMVRNGQSDAEIIAQLNDRFDNDVSNPPQPWYTIVVPFLPYVLGAFLILIVLRRWARKEGDDDDGPAPVSEDDPKLASLRARVADYSDE
ncbi:MAG: cytochrome c-type biogenesis protein CcmH [Bradymonadia bacterium]|jgi:cytochrome c-type biogenesis protein CcmH